MTTAPSGIGERVGIIEAVQTPLGFFVLIVLVIEAVLAVIAGMGNGIDRTMTIGGMLFVILMLISIVAYFAYYQPEALLGKRKDVANGPVSARTKDEMDNLKREIAVLRGEIADNRALRLRVWAYLDGGRWTTIEAILEQLGIAHDPLRKAEVEVIIGNLLKEKRIISESSISRPIFNPRSPPAFRVASDLERGLQARDPDYGWHS